MLFQKTEKLQQSTLFTLVSNTCPDTTRTETFVKVSGDVSLDYALDYIERRSATWAAAAKEFRRRIIRGIN